MHVFNLLLCGIVLSSFEHCFEDRSVQCCLVFLRAPGPLHPLERLDQISGFLWSDELVRVEWVANRHPTVASSSRGFEVWERLVLNVFLRFTRKLP